MDLDDLKWIADLISEVLKHDPASPNKVGERFVAGLNKFISDKESGKKPNLEKALGLRPGRGRPPKKVVPELARELSEIKSQKSWDKTASELNRDPRTLQRSKGRYQNRLDAEKNAEISAKIIEKLKKADAARILARRSRLVIPPK